jgi:hypothetical protein
MNDAPSKPTAPISPAEFVISLGALAVGIAAYRADVANAPVVAPALDALTTRLFRLIPDLQQLPDEAWFWASGAIAAALFAVVAALVYLIFVPSRTEAGRLEDKLKKAKRKRRLDEDGFVVRRIIPKRS